MEEEAKKKTWQDHGREWLDTLVVAISVAMCFRAYFYEPFNIPTGSMQTTLWGYHTVSGVEKTVWDTVPLSWLKWLWTGTKVVEYKAYANGTPRFQDRHDGWMNVWIGTSSDGFKLPTDACREIAGRSFKRGETVWRGAVVSGDFIFVNRWRWNFRRPKDGDVMIFATKGIKTLEEHLGQSTHYIKRMKATPGETYELEHPAVYDARYPLTAKTKVTMGEDEYFACGDNFNNSLDSRYWGPVPGANLRGTGDFVFWPFSGWRIIK